MKNACCITLDCVYTSHSIYVLAFSPLPLRYGGGRKSIGRIMMLLSAAPRRPYIRRRHQFTTQPLDLNRVFCLFFFSSICPLYLFVKAAGVWVGKHVRRMCECLQVERGHKEELSGN